MSPLSGRAGRFIICWSFPASLRADMWKKRPQGHVVFDSNAIANKLTNRVGIRGDLGPIVIGYVHEVLEEGLDMHGVHPFLCFFSMHETQFIRRQRHTFKRTPYWAIFWALSSLLGSGGSTPSLVVSSVQVRISLL